MAMQEIDGLFISTDIHEVNLGEPLESRRAFGDLLGVFSIAPDKRRFYLPAARDYKRFLREGKTSAWALDSLMDDPIKNMTITQDGASHVFVLLDRTFYFPFALETYRRSNGLVQAIMDTQAVVEDAVSEVKRLEQEGATFMTAEQVSNLIGVGHDIPG